MLQPEKIKNSLSREKSLKSRRSLGQMWSIWTTYLLKPVDGASLGIFRIVFYLIMAVDMLRYFKHQWIQSMFVLPHFWFSWFPGIQPWPEHLMFLHFKLAFLAAVLACLGLFYRPASLFFGFSVTYFFLIDKANFINHFYLICLLSCLMMLLPANRCFSIDALIGRLRLRGREHDRVAQWNVLILKYLVLIIYFYAALWKISPDWLAGVPCQYFTYPMASKLPALATIVNADWFGHFLAYGGLLVDATVPVFLCFAQTFWLGALISVCFHVMNSFLFSIGVFPFLMMGTLALFPSYDWPRTLWAKVLSLFGRSGATDKELSDERKPHEGQPVSDRRGAFGFSTLSTVVALLFFHVFLVVQMFLPLRFLAYPGNPDWTEQGYYFCWRMMLHSKRSSYARFIIRDARTGEVLAQITGKKFLNKNQRWNMGRHPELAHQFAVWLGDQVEQTTGNRPIINVQLRASVNGRPWQFLIDPTVDLAAQPLNDKPKEWIVPLADYPPVFVRKMKYDTFDGDHFGKLAGKVNANWQ